MFSGESKGPWRTLRFRLLVWNTLVVLLIVLPTLIGVREWLRYTLHHEFDEILKEDVLEVRLALAQFFPDWEKFYEEMRRKAQGHAHRRWFVRVFNSGGDLVWSNPDAPEVNGPPPGTSELLQTVEDTGESFRLAEAQVDQAGLPRLVVRVGSSLRDLDEDVWLLSRTMVLVGAAIVVLAPLGAYWLAGRATRPVADIIETARRLRPGNLEERLAIRGPATNWTGYR